MTPDKFDDAEYEKKIFDILKKKIDEATPEELQWALGFIAGQKLTRQETLKKVFEELWYLYGSGKWDTIKWEELKAKLEEI